MAPTRAQLEAEAWWGREVRPPQLVALGEGVRQHLGVGPGAIGIKGDEDHLSGGHRSPEWILRSSFSRRGADDGSLVLSTGGRAGAGDRDLRALDITPGQWGTPENRRRMIRLTEPLDAAVRAGRLPQVRRFWGTLDGRHVHGWDTHHGRKTTSDDSHLDHLHIEMYPDRVRNDHGNVLAVLTGGGDMDPNASNIIPGLPNWQVFADLWKWVATSRFGDPTPRGDDRFQTATWPGKLASELATVKAELAATKLAVTAIASVGGNADSARIVEAMERLAVQDRQRDEQHAAELAKLRTQLDEALRREGELQAALDDRGAVPAIP